MGKQRKSINLFLMDGEANGRIKVSISNWTGLGYKIPRERLLDCKEMPELSQSSVYFLFGKSLSGNDPVYIGQAGIRKSGGGILTRLLEHASNPDKDYWTEAVVFTTSNNSFGPTELSFLENKFCNMAIQAKRYDVKNAVDPTPGNITEEKESELEEFADYSQLILGALGYKVFDPIETPPKAPPLPISSTYSTKKKPPLPSHSLKIGKYIRTAMRQLSESGYVFSESEIEKMCTSEWTSEIFHTKKAFMRNVVDESTTTTDSAGNMRFWNEKFVFGEATVFISKEWYPKHYSLFDSWYNSL